MDMIADISIVGETENTFAYIAMCSGGRPSNIPLYKSTIILEILAPEDTQTKASTLMTWEERENSGRF